MPRIKHQTIDKPKEWDQGALKLKDREIEDAERFYRDSSMSAAAELN